MSISDSVAWIRKQLRLCVADVNEITDPHSWRICWTYDVWSL